MMTVFNPYLNYYESFQNYKFGGWPQKDFFHLTLFKTHKVQNSPSQTCYDPDKAPDRNS